MDEGEERQDRSSLADGVIDVLATDLAGEAAGCLFEAALTGCAPALLLLVGVPALLMWWR